MPDRLDPDVDPLSNPPTLMNLCDQRHARSDTQKQRAYLTLVGCLVEHDQAMPPARRSGYCPARSCSSDGIRRSGIPSAFNSRVGPVPLPSVCHPSRGSASPPASSAYVDADADRGHGLTGLGERRAEHSAQLFEDRRARR